MTGGQYQTPAPLTYFVLYPFAKRSIHTMKSYLTVLLLCFFGGLVTVNGQAVSEEARPFTTHLPPVDKIEILKVSGVEGIEKIINTKTLDGADVQKLATLWRTQQYADYYSAACHEPAYAIKFYAKEKLLSYVSICWGCQNIYSQLKEQNFSAGFNAHGAKGKALFQFLHKRLG